MHIHLNLSRALKIPGLERLRQLDNLRHRVRLQQVLVVQVVVEDVEPFLRVFDLGRELLRGAGFDARHLGGEDRVDGFGGGGDVAAVAGGCWGD